MLERFVYRDHIVNRSQNIRDRQVAKALEKPGRYRHGAVPYELRIKY
jgi:hypothetical protein